MKKYMILVSMVAVFSFAFASGVLAQREMMWKGSGGWGPWTPYCKMFNYKTVQNITGEVVSVNKFTPIKGMSEGVSILLKTDNETISVHLGPRWYIEHQDVMIMQKDNIEVTGSLITFNDEPTLIATEIKKGKDLLTLRNLYGFPKWRGWEYKKELRDCSIKSPYQDTRKHA